MKNQLKNDIEEKVKQTVAKTSVHAEQSAVRPITDAIMEEVQPRIDHLTNNEPWYQSRVTLGAILIVITRLLAHFGYAIPEELHGEILNLVIAFGPYVGAAMAIWGSRFAKKPLGQ